MFHHLPRINPKQLCAVRYPQSRCFLVILSYIPMQLSKFVDWVFLNRKWPATQVFKNFLLKLCFDIQRQGKNASQNTRDCISAYILVLLPCLLLRLHSLFTFRNWRSMISTFRPRYLEILGAFLLETLGHESELNLNLLRKQFRAPLKICQSSKFA